MTKNTNNSTSPAGAIARLVGGPAPATEPATIDYPPISAHPEYVVEQEKLKRFNDQLEATSAKLETLYIQLNAKGTLSAESSERAAIAKAESLLAGDAPKDILAEIREANRLAEALRGAIDAQNIVVRDLSRSLARAAGLRFKQEHQKRVKRMMDAVIELYAASKAEQEVRERITQLGYPDGSLPAMVLSNIEDPHCPWGGVTNYWFQEAKKYVMTPEELAAGVRKSRLAAALG